MSQTMDFRAVYEQHFDFVWRVLRRMGVSASDLADVAQEVFIVVHRRLPSFEGRSKLTTWLFSICWRVCQDRRRLRRNDEQPSDELELQAFAGATDNPDPVERRQEAIVLEKVLAQIPQPQRTVFILFEIEEMEASEIAEVMSVPLGTVHSRLRLARESFLAAASRYQAHMNRLAPQTVKQHA